MCQRRVWARGTAPQQPLDEPVIAQLAVLDLDVVIGAAIACAHPLDTRAQALPIAHVVLGVKANPRFAIGLATLPRAALDREESGDVLVECGVAHEVQDPMIGRCESLPDRVIGPVVVEGLRAQPVASRKALGEHQLPPGGEVLAVELTGGLGQVQSLRKRIPARLLGELAPEDLAETRCPRHLPEVGHEQVRA